MPELRRSLAGLAATGMAAGLILTGAVSGSAAPTAASASSRVVTLTSSTSSAFGQLTLRLRYEIKAGHQVKPLSLTYSGGSSLRLKHPVLVIVLRPLLGPFVHKAGKKPVRIALPRILWLRDSRHFSGTLRLPKVSWVRRKAGQKRHPVLAPLGAVLSATLGSATSRKPISIQAVAGMQTGILIGPAGA